MVGLKWCLKQNQGIRLVELSDNLVDAYLRMADDSLGTMNRERKYNSIFSISACYYSMYYSLYAVMMKIGIRCEIHSCSLELMKNLLKNYYSEKDVKTIKKAFDIRNLTQYYANKVIDEKDIEFILSEAQRFYDKSKDIISNLGREDIKALRDDLLNILEELK